MNGYHLRFLKVDETRRTIDGVDVVRVPQDAGGDDFGVQLHARSTLPPISDEVVLRLVRAPDESEADFVKRAFHEAAIRRQPNEQMPAHAAAAVAQPRV